MEAYAESVLRTLLTTLELPLDAVGRNIRLIGRDPVVPSRYRVGLASASALARRRWGSSRSGSSAGGGTRSPP
jgi:hypothetical protein